MFFISVIVLFISVCFFFKSSSSLLNISCVFSMCASSLFPSLWIILTIIILNHFQVDCLCPLLFLLVGVYLVPFFATYFSIISLCLNFCVCGLLSTGCSTVVPLASSVCPLVGVVGPGACAGFLLGRTGACPLGSGAGSFSSGGQCHVNGLVLRWL